MYLFKLEADQLYALFHGIEMKPDYLPYFSMNFDSHLVDIECGLTRTSISPANIADAGLGFFNHRNTAVSVDTALAYWGKQFCGK